MPSAPTRSLARPCDGLNSRPVLTSGTPNIQAPLPHGCDRTLRPHTRPARHNATNSPGRLALPLHPSRLSHGETAPLLKGATP